MNIKNINQRTVDIVFGYIRQCKKSRQFKEIHIIPDLVIYTILYFYYIREEFGVCGDNLKINKLKDILTCIEWKNTYKGAYGYIDITIKNIIYIWNFKILNVSRQEMFIGIESSKNKIHTNQDWIWSKDYYLYDCNNKLWTSHGGNKGYGEKFEKNDELKMIINTNKKTIEYYKNDISLGIAFKDIKITENKIYHMFVSANFANDSIQLINFSVL